MNTLEKIFAEQLIKLIPDIHKAVCTGLIKDKSKNISQTPSLSHWLMLYRRSRSFFFITILSMLSKNENASIFFEQLSFYLLPDKEKSNILSEAVNEIKSYSDDEIEIFKSKLEDYNKRLKQESDAIFNENYNNISRDEVKIFISDSNIQFFSRIIIPCIVLYGKFPSQLLRQARQGDDESIKLLARIDHSIIHDKRISQYIHHMSFHNPTKHKLLIRSLVKDHKKPNIKDLKIDAASLIFLFNTLSSKILKTKKLTTPQIRKLFVNESKLHGRLDDLDLPQSDETLRQGIKRNTMWNGLIKLPDKI